MTEQTNFKQALGRFATGVCVVTYQCSQTKGIDGVTISAFSSVSLDPSTIMFCLGRGGHTGALFSGVERFCVNILSSEQCALAYQFAGKNREGLEDLIDNLDGLPMIKNSLASLICTKGNVYTEGDHDIVIGNVDDILLGDESLQPLLYFKSKIIENYQHDNG